jgi:hypothetical protein
MLSIEEARELLDDKTLTDAEVTEIRDGFRILGEIIFEQWLSERKAPAQDGEPPTVKE